MQPSCRSWFIIVIRACLVLTFAFIEGTVFVIEIHGNGIYRFSLKRIVKLYLLLIWESWFQQTMRMTPYPPYIAQQLFYASWSIPLYRKSKSARRVRQLLHGRWSFTNTHNYWYDVLHPRITFDLFAFARFMSQSKWQVKFKIIGRYHQSNSGWSYKLPIWNIIESIGSVLIVSSINIASCVVCGIDLFDFCQVCFVLTFFCIIRHWLDGGRVHL